MLYSTRFNGLDCLEEFIFGSQLLITINKIETCSSPPQMMLL